METKFTKGPWKVKKYEPAQGDEFHIQTTSKNYQTICEVRAYNYIWEGVARNPEQLAKEAEANAKLISIAPDLYQAACEVVKLFDLDSENKPMIRWFNESEIEKIVNKLRAALSLITNNQKSEI